MTGLRRCGKPYASKEAAERSKKGRTGHYLPYECACGAWHLNKLLLKPVPSWSAPKDTGPDRKTRALVVTRDGHRCVRCGKPCGPGIGAYSIQHRIARGVGGDNAIPNLILLCGSATSPDGCHYVAESRDREAQAHGYWLESWQDPAAEGVMYASEDGGVTFWLEADGGLTQDAPAGVIG